MDEVLRRVLGRFSNIFLNNNVEGFALSYSAYADDLMIFDNGPQELMYKLSAPRLRLPAQVAEM